MKYLLIRHTVSDFSKWKPIYDRHVDVRNAAGLTEAHISRNVENPNEVVLLFEVADLAKARAFAQSADLAETMRQAGVVGKPDIIFLDDGK